MKRINIQSRHALLTLLFLLLIAYSTYQARFLIFGPQINIDRPQDGDSVENPIVIIEGQAKNISWISLNDRQIFTDEKGWWSEKLIVSEGISIMTLRVRDRFGRRVEKSVRILLPAQTGLN